MDEKPLDWFRLPWRREHGSNPMFRINGTHFYVEVDNVMYTILRRGTRKLAASASLEAVDGDYTIDDRVNANELYDHLVEKLGSL